MGQMDIPSGSSPRLRDIRDIVVLHGQIRHSAHIAERPAGACQKRARALLVLVTTGASRSLSGGAGAGLGVILAGRTLPSGGIRDSVRGLIRKKGTEADTSTEQRSKGTEQVKSRRSGQRL